MPILHVKFPDIWPGWSVSKITLTSVPNSSTYPLPTSERTTIQPETVNICVDPKSETDYYSDCPVFRGSAGPGKYSMASSPFALKFAMRDDLVGDLVAETEMYIGPLQPLQGSTVPRCYGLYTGTGEDGRTIACLVLEYWGEGIKKPFRYLSMDLRIRILQQLGEIHRQGLLHGDFAERNVLQRNGDIRIIDFDQAIPHHHCQCDMDFRPDDLSVDRKQFGCEQLWEVCRHNMRIWKN